MSLPDSAQPVAAWLAARGHDHAPRLLDASARTAQEAADALGVQLGQIAKSIVFRRLPDNAAVMVVTSGDQRVDEKKLAALVCSPGQKLGRADPDFVRERTGFAIGGVSPVAHAGAVLQVLDLSLFRFDQVWAAAGHPHVVFAAAPAQLALLTQARLDDVASMAPSVRTLAMLRARAACVQAAPAGDPPSPCISVCRMDPLSGLCIGCMRSIDEIAAWSTLAPPARREVWRSIEQRAAALL
jgi:prolyl-tRNA editing enzyme YbaK/EbsC (Cys-tRNA(Pro) deacylase)/predicted Fe-S protein YdhL (DUF1289 family)